MSSRSAPAVQHGAWSVMLSRVLGIVAGVALTLAFTVTILPTSAHGSIDRKLAGAMRELLTMHGLCWLPMGDSVLAQVCNQAGSGGQEDRVGGKEGKEGEEAALLPGEVRSRLHAFCGHACVFVILPANA
jgi:hypothetical protein